MYKHELSIRVHVPLHLLTIYLNSVFNINQMLNLKQIEHGSKLRGQLGLLFA